MPNLEQLSNGKFQYNMECIQWLYDYSQKLNASKGGPGPPSMYSGFLKRQDALLKQLQAKGMYLEVIDGNLPDDIIQMYMSPHLVPSTLNWGGANQLPMPMMLGENHGMMPYTLQSEVPSASQISQHSLGMNSQTPYNPNNNPY